MGFMTLGRGEGRGWRCGWCGGAEGAGEALTSVSAGMFQRPRGGGVCCVAIDRVLLSCPNGRLRREDRDGTMRMPRCLGRSADGAPASSMGCHPGRSDSDRAQREVRPSNSCVLLPSHDMRRLELDMTRGPVVEDRLSAPRVGRHPRLWKCRGSGWAGSALPHEFGGRDWTSWHALDVRGEAVRAECGGDSMHYGEATG